MDVDCDGDCNFCDLHPLEVKCPECGWHGSQDEAEILHEDDYTEYLCPDCKVDVEFCQPENEQTTPPDGSKPDRSSDTG